MMHLRQEMNINTRQCIEAKQGLETPSDALSAKLPNKEQKQTMMP